MEILLSPEFIRVSALVILNGALTAYLVRVPRGAGSAHWLAAFTAGTAGLYVFRAVEVSVVTLSTSSLWALKTAETVVVIVALGALVQFAYRFLDAPYPREMRAALVVSLLAVLGVTVFAFLLRGSENVRDPLMAVYSVAWLVAEAWSVGVLIRKRRRVHSAGDQRAARAFSAFAFVCLADALVLVTIVGLMIWNPSQWVSNLVWVFGILPAIFALHYARVAVYIEHAPEPTSLRAKLVGLALAMALALIGMAAVLSAPIDNPNLADAGAGSPAWLAMQRDMHDESLPLFGLMLVATAGALIAFPLALRRNLVQPVERLLDGVRRVNAGDRDVSLPLGVRDEVGRLTEGFNAMTASLRDAEEELRGYAHQLEARVEERTAELQASTEEIESQARQLEELDRLKTRFFANISHEFRTPLTLILGPLDDALAERHGPLDDALATQFTVMQRNARHLLNLINQLLDLSKLEAEAFEIQTSPTDIAALAQTSVGMFSGRAERDGIALLFNAASAPVVATVDPDRIDAVLTNLVANALSFTDAGGKIRVSVGRDDSAAIVTVEDTGRGIAAEDLPHIFDRFRQVDGSSTRAQGGTGIGLALAKELTELHGGTLDVESTVGFGTRFTIRLPAMPEASLPQAEPSLPAPARGPTRSDATLASSTDPPEPTDDKDDRPLVLVVEDNADLRTFVRSHIEESYRVVEAENGRIGLNLARQLRPDLILSDVMMPELDGVELTQAIKADARLSDTPVVLLTARSDETSTLDGLAAGADDYLTKPFSPSELLARVANAVSARQHMRERYSDEVVVGPSDIVVSSAEAAFLERVRDVAEAHLDDSEFGIDALAHEVGMSRRQLGRRLRKALDTSPAAFVRSLRLARAAQLLEQRTGTVAETAYAVGYRDPDHFSKQFREAYGVSPSAYRPTRAGTSDPPLVEPSGP
ncbi:MAG: hypothetical protein Rubg2KO_07780 [Rubricoccaceae bacterium]